MTFSKRADKRKAEGMSLSKFITKLMGLKKKPPKQKFEFIDEGERQVHLRQDKPVPILRRYHLTYNRYNPQTCRRPKEALKAAKRVLREELANQDQTSPGDHASD